MKDGVLKVPQMVAFASLFYGMLSVTLSLGFGMRPPQIIYDEWGWAGLAVVVAPALPGVIWFLIWVYVWEDREKAKSLEQFLRDNPDCYVCGDQSTHQVSSVTMAEPVSVCDTHWGDHRAVGKVNALQRFPNSADHINNCRPSGSFSAGRDPQSWAIEWRPKRERRTDEEYVFVCTDPRHDPYEDPG